MHLGKGQNGLADQLAPGFGSLRNASKVFDVNNICITVLWRSKRSVI